MYQRLRILLAAYSAAPATRPHRLSPWIISGFLCLLLLVMDGALAVEIWLAWPLVRATGGLLVGDVGSTVLGIFPVVLQVMAVAMVFTAHGDFADDLRGAAIALRSACAARDPLIAPAAPADAPATMDAHGFAPALPDAPLPVAVPAPLMVSKLSISLLLATGVLVALVAIGMLVAIPFGLGVSLARVFADPVATALLAVAGCFAALSLIPFVVSRRWGSVRARQQMGVAITLAADGLSFHRAESPRRQRQIAWREARSLARIAYKDFQTHLRVIYLLDAGADVLLWEEPPTERYVSPAQQHATVEWQASAQRLAALVAGRTGLPLLDLSNTVALLTQHSAARASLANFSAYMDAIVEGDATAAQILWQALDAKTQRRLSRLRWSPSARMTERGQTSLAQRAPRLNAIQPKAAQSRREWVRLMQALLPYYPSAADADYATPERERIRRMERRRQAISRLLARVQAVVIVATLLIGAGAWLDTTYADHATRDLAQRVQGETPLYATSFHSPDGAWPQRTPTSADTSSYTYVDGAYQISGSDRANSVMAQTETISMRDGAEQVTVTEQGRADENNLAWVGLTLDANADGSTFTTFMIDELGDWSLSHFDGSLPAAQQWSTPDAGQSDAVRRGAGASNTLLLIRQGDIYLLYVNGALVDTYADHDHALTPGGFVGVYLDEGGFSARFSDFAIAPAPAIQPFWMR